MKWSFHGFPLLLSLTCRENIYQRENISWTLKHSFVWKHQQWSRQWRRSARASGCESNEKFLRRTGIFNIRIVVSVLLTRELRWCYQNCIVSCYSSHLCDSIDFFSLCRYVACCKSHDNSHILSAVSMTVEKSFCNFSQAAISAARADTSRMKNFANLTVKMLQFIIVRKVLLASATSPKCYGLAEMTWKRKTGGRREI